jgi:hypothetical protein
MKTQVHRKSREELIESFPIENLVSGWFFRCTEESPSQYVAAGIDHWGRQVSRSNSDPEQALKECVQDAQAIANAQANC